MYYKMFEIETYLFIISKKKYVVFEMINYK